MYILKSDLDGILASMKQMEDRFNKKFNYPYVFLNEEPFSDEFKPQVNYCSVYLKFSDVAI